MKKYLRLIMLTLLCAVGSNAWGGELNATYNFSTNINNGYGTGYFPPTNEYTNPPDGTIFKLDDVSLIITGTFQWKGGQLQTTNDKNKMTISVPEGYVITGIDITSSSSASYACLDKWKTDVGIYTVTGNTASWSGRSGTIVFSYNSSYKSIRHKTISVTYMKDEQTTPLVAPSFDPVSGTEVENNTNVTISPESEDVYIAYTTDGSKPTIANKSTNPGPIIVPINNKVMTIRAVAMDVTGSSISEENKATYSIIGEDNFVTTFDFASPNHNDYETNLEINDGEYIPTPTTWKSGFVSFLTIGKFKWTSAPQLNNNDPTNNTMTLSVPSGYIITNLTITGFNLSNLSVSEGEYVILDNDDNYSDAIWTGNAETIVFTCSSSTVANINIKTITVSYEKLKETIPVATDYITYCSENNLKFKEGEAYIPVGTNKKSNGLTVVLNKVTEVKANTGILIKKPSDAEEVKPIILESSNKEYPTNMLVGVLEPTDISQIDGDNTNFVLANGTNGIGFYIVQSTGGTLKPHRAYLQIPSSVVQEIGSSNMVFIVEDETDGIESLTPTTSPRGEESSYYSIDGRRINGMPVQKGIYIQNGKKIMIK